MALDFDFIKEFHEYADIKTVGIPRALQYYRYGRMWLEFFDSLGVSVVLSDETNKDIVASGVSRSIDEACYSLKVYLGHVASLIGKCDAIFVPRIAGYKIRTKFCTRFEALYDTVATIFSEDGIKLVTLSHDSESEGDIADAYIELGMKFGKTRGEAKKAYSAAVKAQAQAAKSEAKAQKTALGEDGIKLLLAAHPYIAHDPYIGGQTVKILRRLGCSVLYVDWADPDAAVKRSHAIVHTLPWLESREILGTIDLYRKKADGIILMSAYPCCADSMANEYIIRTVKDLPILQVTVDVQDGTAGLETRLESFVDIIKFRENGGYGKKE